ncbi:hypothetical protein [Lentzea sp. CC55]|uniref:LppU/SCO3897 family protein n=1 Tax=Lentzea sp. CC55 TaxID=2884909 RepID=UPI001F33B892|nr:hypothetical protein [Lentzea sp. CC55]MCG8922768.1 hypothetical protein [Lentzea sp. CC55]
MTTPPIPPATPEESGERPDVWAAPDRATPFVSYPAAALPPHGTPPKQSSRVGLVIASVLGFLLIATVSTAVYLLPNGGGSASGSNVNSSPPVISTSVLPSATAGDCVKLTGASFNVKYEQVPCGTGTHNYTVSKVLGSQSEKCGEDPGSYMKYHGHSGRKSVNICLIPAFVDGRCYRFTTFSLSGEFETPPCGGLEVVRVKVLTNTADKTACGPSPALAYPDIKTTYCFSRTG